jgi:iron(III) transport system substrate-binding protein
VRLRRAGPYGALVLTLVALAACGGESSSSEGSSISLYTCASDTTVGPVIDAFEKEHAGTDVQLFRAPTGELNARVAGDVRAGGLRADVVWACDPLTMQDYVDQGLVGGWTPETAIADDYRTDDYVGVAILYVVAVTHDGVPPPAAWSDLASPVYAGGVAVPDPGLAASALGALGYFASHPDYGTDFYSALKKNGASQVSTPDDVVTGVAEGSYDAGVTIANSAYLARDDGAPIEVSWPSPGAVGIYGPVAIAAETSEEDTAKDFVSFLTSEAGQTVVGESGAYPTLAGVPGPPKPDGAKIVYPDWPSLSTDKDALLADYQKIFGG